MAGSINIKNLILALAVSIMVCTAAHAETLDTFTDADWTELPTHNANWTVWNSVFEIETNAVSEGANSEAIAVWEQPYAANCNATITVTAKGGSNDWACLMCRVTTLINTTYDGYAFCYDVLAGTDQVAIQRRDNAVPTVLGVKVDRELTNGEVMEIECDGSTIRAIVDGTEIMNRTDETYGDAGYVGFIADGWTALFDTFTASNITGEPPATPVAADTQVIFIQ